MKKASILFLVIMLMLSSVKAQLQQKDDPSASKSHENTFAFIISKCPYAAGLPQQSKKMDFLNSKTMTWKWDTLICFDTLSRFLERHSQSFDSAGNAGTLLVEQWQSGAWVNDYRWTYTYNTSGYVTIALMEQWQSGAWTNSMRYNYTYNSSEKLLFEIHYTWLYGAWANYDRVSYTYNSNGQVTIALDGLWQNTWANYWRYIYTYDSAGNVITSLWQTWYNTTWTDIYQFTYNYDMNGNLITELRQQYQNSAWENLLRYTNSYDPYNEINGQLVESWQDSAWVNNGRSIYVCNSYGYSASGTFNTWRNSSWQPGMNNLSVYSIRDEIYRIVDPVYRYTATYASVPAGVCKLPDKNKGINIYPNPCSGLLYIAGAAPGSNLAVYDLTGNCLISRQTVNTKDCINLQSLHDGLYFIRIEQDRKISTYKIVIGER